MRARRVGANRSVLALLCLLVVPACTGGTTPADSSPSDVRTEAAADSTADVSPDSGPMVCTTDTDCTDGVFCNGTERCMPGSATADARGCIPSAAPACTAMQTCDEVGRRCSTNCADADGDGHHAASCGGDDCDDNDAMRFPGNPESCDGSGHDEDCDPCTVGAADGDTDHDTYVGDGCSNSYGGAPPTCDPMHTRVVGSTHRVTGSDCDDVNANVHPNQTESCNGIDDNCDGMIDEGVTRNSYYPDCDNDHYGLLGAPAVMGCAEPTAGPAMCPSGGWATDATDCNDTNGLVHPTAPEACDSVDNDCNGMVDDSVVTSTYYPDCDSDHYGTATGGVTGCAPPSASPAACPSGMWALENTDCDDASPTVHPTQAEVCDGVDNDCSGMVDDGLPTMTYSPDCDGDGFGATTGGVTGCRAPSSAPCAGGTWVANGTDCNDSTASVHPGATDTCNSIDDNCDGTVDEGGLMHPDVDNDGRGNAAITMMHACSAGWVFNGDDCDDSRAETYGGAVPARELCDGLDNDCSLPGAMAGGSQPGEDNDNDRHSPVAAMCLGRGEPGALGSAYPKDDCNDADPFTYTGAAEICGDGRDQNCDGIADNPMQSICTDADGDGHGDPATRRTIMSCSIPAGNVPGAACDDCNDARGTVFPGNREICDRVDNDCSTGGGAATDEDVDGDSHSPLTSTCLGLGEAGAPATALPRDDCNDGDFARHPGATEVCDGQDFNCSSGGAAAVDEDADSDGHAPIGAMCVGFGETGGSMALPKDDCDDARATVHGGLAASADTSTCDGLDNDCEGSTSELTVACAGGGFCAPGGVCSRAAAVMQIEASGQSTCTLMANGTVRCWGGNSAGQLGNGTTVNSPTPVTVSGLSAAVEISSGINHTCARLGDGTVRCWGSNLSGQLGDGTTTIRTTPVAVSGLTGVVQISAGQYHTCARLSDGTLRCWGDNGQGQLGDGTTTLRNVPTAVTGVVASLEVSVGAYHTCARFAGGTVRCWGSNLYGQLGDGTTTGHITPTLVPGFTNAVELSSGSQHTCARLADGTVRCWGINTTGTIGDGTTTSRSSPTAVTGLTGAVQVSVGDSHSCARLNDGTLRCWGANSVGQLGDGTTSGRTTPATVTGLAGVAEVSAGQNHTCARLIDSSVRCWGNNSSGQIGDGTTTARSSPTVVPAFAGVVELTSGGFHRCARFGDGTVRCWGSNSAGQLGDGTTTNRLNPTLVPGLTNVVELSAGQGHTCARLADGTARCWGANAFYGQLGDGTLTNRLTPTVVTGLTNVAELAAGKWHTCARIGDGTARCWGSNLYGQLGDGTTTQRSTAAAVPGLSGVLEVHTGWSHVCARLSGGTTRCWGINTYGQVGDGTMTNRLVPTAIGGLAGAVELSAGDVMSFARLGDGTVRSWGLNDRGELGDGTTTNRLTPTVAPGLTGVVELTAGDDHACARSSDGSVRCWGDNTYGALGDGTMTAHPSPTVVPGLSGVVEISAGTLSTCVRVSDGSVRCWGDNAAGQLGDGTTTGRLTPTTIWSL